MSVAFGDCTDIHRLFLSVSICVSVQSTRKYPCRSVYFAKQNYMPRIAGINIPEDKQIKTALTYIYGIGLSLARKILNEAGVEPQLRASQLTPEQVNKLKEIIEKEYKIEGELRREVMMNIKRLKDIGSWRGSRHIK